MAKITSKPVKLKHSRAVKKGRTSRYKGNEKFRQDDEFYNIQTRELSKMVDGGIVQKRISAYRHWTKFLRRKNSRLKLMSQCMLDGILTR